MGEKEAVFLLPAGDGICEDISSRCQSTQWSTGPCWRWCCGGHKPDPLPPGCLWGPAWCSVPGTGWSRREPCLLSGHWETDKLLPSDCWTMSNITTSYCLTWELRGWNSGSYPCLCICGTAVWLSGWTAPSAQTWALHPLLVSSPSISSSPSEALSPSTLQTAHCHGYHHTQRPGTTSANAPALLPPSDWEQAQFQQIEV